MPDLAAEAEKLVRALRGVRHARIELDEHGVRAVHVTADDEAAAEHLAGHVRSALLAGFDTPVVPGRIHVRTENGGETPGSIPAATSPHDRGDRVRLLHEPEGSSPGLQTDQQDPRLALEAPDAPKSDLSPTSRPRLVSVDVDRPGDDRVICRVAIAYRTRVHRAEATAVDLPGAAAHAAAEAAVRALTDAGWDELELLGLRDVEIAGRDFLLVALRRNGTSTRIRSASAPVVGSPERSAAEATLAAAEDTY
jgi:hypothetical protein